MLIVTFSYICSHISKGDSPNRVKIKDATKITKNATTKRRQQQEQKTQENVEKATQLK